MGAAVARCVRCAAKHPGAAPPAYKKCEDCGLKSKSYGVCRGLLPTPFLHEVTPRECSFCKGLPTLALQPMTCVVKSQPGPLELSETPPPT